MVKQNKNTKNSSQSQSIEDRISHLGANIGLTAMSVAALAGLIELHEARGHKFMPALQPAYAHASEPVDSNRDSSHEAGREFVRREKDEIRHMSVSYGTSMRSHPTAGTV